MRGRLFVAAASVSAAGLVGAIAPSPAPAAVPVVVVDGRGFGHGVGMAQDGAFWMGKGGSSTEQILGHFYPGTTIGKGGAGEVRVPVHAPGESGALLFPDGGEIRVGRDGEQPAGFPVRVGPGAEVRISWDGTRYHVDGEGVGARSTSAARERPATSSTTAPPSFFEPPPGPTESPLPTTTTTTAPPPPAPPRRAGLHSESPMWAVPSSGGVVTVPGRQRSYRGVIEATAANGTFRFVNAVDVETYLRGMGEVRDPSWPPASLRAQAVAARTYALRAMAANGELCDSQRCQVYLGATAEYGAMNKAVADTRGQVVLYGKALASAVYSSNGGGVSASREEGFGTTGGDYPYLRSAPYTTGDPKPWKVEVGVADAAGRLGYKGTIRAIWVSQAGPSKRALTVTVDGSTGVATVPGLTFAKALGLRSTLFTVGLGTSDAAPAELGRVTSGLQAPPDAPATAFVDIIPEGFSYDGYDQPPLSIPPPTAPPPVRAVAHVAPDRPADRTLVTAAAFLLISAAATWTVLVLGGILEPPRQWRRRPRRGAFTEAVLDDR